MTCLEMSVSDIQTKVTQYDNTLSERLNDDNFQLNPNNDNAFFLLDLYDLDDDTIIPRNGDEHAIDVNDVIPQDDTTEEALIPFLTRRYQSTSVKNTHSVQ